MQSASYGARSGEELSHDTTRTSVARSDASKHAFVCNQCALCTVIVVAINREHVLRDDISGAEAWFASHQPEYILRLE